jgi:hypothetical protein
MNQMGFEIGQEVWFVRGGAVASGVVTGFRPWATDPVECWAELSIVDDLGASVHPSDLFRGEVPATEYLLERALRDVRILRNRLRELAKETTKKAKKTKKTEGGRP